MSLLDKATGNFWIDNGLVMLHQVLRGGNLPEDVNSVVQRIVQRIYVETGKTAEYLDSQTQQIKTYKKRNWKEPIGLFISVVDQVPKQKVGDKEYYTRPPEPRIAIQPAGNQRCDFCGEKGKVVSAKLYLFPFVIDPNKFANFYSHARRGLKMCARCAVAGFAAFESWLWRRQGKTFHFFLFHTDLDRLHALHNSLIAQIQLSESTSGGNFEAPFFGEYPFENLFALLLRLFEWLHHREPEGELDPILAELTGACPVAGNPIVIYAISGIDSGKSFSMRALNQFDRFQPFYRLYKSWLEGLAGLSATPPHQALIQVFRQFQHRRQQSTETLWREQICRAILQQADPAPTVERFLYEVSTDTRKPAVYGTREVLHIYLREVMKMDEKLLNILSGFGYHLGSQAADKQEMGLLYALRNAKNLDQFMEVLNQIQFTLGLTINPELLRVEPGERIAGAPWNRVKTLLAIHAMNAYLRKQQGSTTTEGGEQ
ncbi:hypothetical protein HRbin15_01182 [bacterium HR15]|nr:hypothetical protein HRbin15_01182 [bacterium HR15]